MNLSEVVSRLTMWRNTISDKKRIEALNTALEFIDRARPRNPYDELPDDKNCWCLILTKSGMINQVCFIEGQFCDMCASTDDNGSAIWKVWQTINMNDVLTWWRLPIYPGEVQDDG